MKTDQLNGKADEQEKVKDKRVDALERDKDEINRKKDDDDKDIARMHTLIQQEVDDSNKRKKEEEERQEELERKKREKFDMEDAARYIQRKWKWYQDVGKLLAKKRKKGKKGKKKKK